jgi:hypothetical protein
VSKYTAGQFIKAIKGTGGVISSIADKVGCTWHTAKRYIEDYPTIQEAYIAERNRVSDKAQNNIITAIVNKSDLAMSKWWLQVKEPEFMPKEERRHANKEGEDFAVTINIKGSDG